jgi:hypothetical protein
MSTTDDPTGEPETPSDAGRRPSLSNLTVKAWLLSYLELLKKSPQVTAEALEGYRLIVTCHLIPAIGEIKVLDLQARDIQTVVDGLIWSGSDRMRPLSTNGVRKSLAVLNGALCHASAAAVVPVDAMEYLAERRRMQIPTKRRPASTVERAHRNGSTEISAPPRAQRARRRSFVPRLGRQRLPGI